MKTLLHAKKETRGGYNKEIFLLNVKTFKKLCLKSNTKKADEIHDYFIHLEEVLQNILIEESEQLQNELEQKEQSEKLLLEKQVILN